MQNKIIIIGKMASGKTSMAERLCGEFGFQGFSLADKVREIARDLFGMTEKDRTLLQQIGCKMREIRPEVWYEYLHDCIHFLEISDFAYDTKADYNPHFHAVIDDVRFVNEYEFFGRRDWFPVKLEVPKEIRRPRIEELYGKVTDEQLTDPSEMEVDLIHCPNVVFEKKHWTVDDKWDAFKKIIGAENLEGGHSNA